MKTKSLLLAASLLISLGAQAQWTTSGTNIYNTNAGNVGIGTSSPSEKLHINGSIRGNQSGAVRISTGNGYVDVGPKNADYAHFYTDRPYGFYFGGPVTVRDHLTGYSSADLNISTQSPSTFQPVPRITIVNSTGYVGIGTTSPSYLLDVNGTMIAAGYLTSSDERLKRDIKKIGSALERISQINGVTYTFDPQNKLGRTFPKGEKTGLIAQQVQKVFPNMVSADANGYLAVDYIALVPVLLEAVKELKSELDLTKEMFLEKATSKELEVAQLEERGISLKQNYPNPTSRVSVIAYSTEETSAQTSLVIHNLAGKQVKMFTGLRGGKGQLDVDTSDMEPGLYLYSLVVNGQVTLTKKMIVSK
jgi:hypothetical protein